MTPPPGGMDLIGRLDSARGGPRPPFGIVH
jgi:hypothetical protein